MRRRYIRLALLCSVPSWVVSRAIAHHKPDLGFKTAFGRIYGNEAA